MQLCAPRLRLDFVWLFAFQSRRKKFVVFVLMKLPDRCYRKPLRAGRRICFCQTSTWRCNYTSCLRYQIYLHFQQEENMIVLTSGKHRTDAQITSTELWDILRLILIVGCMLCWVFRWIWHFFNLTFVLWVESWSQGLLPPFSQWPSNCLLFHREALFKM